MFAFRIFAIILDAIGILMQFRALTKAAERKDVAECLVHLGYIVVIAILLAAVMLTA